MSLCLILVALVTWWRCETAESGTDRRHFGEVTQILAYSAVIAAGFDLVVVAVAAGNFHPYNWGN